MNTRFLHVYEDTLQGREALLQTAHFCRLLDAAPVVYIPRTQRFLMYLENRITQVDLAVFPKDERAMDLAFGHASEILADSGLDARFFTPVHWTSQSLPDLPADFDFMNCPLPGNGELPVYSDLGMRRLPREAPFSVLLPTPQFKAWQSIALFQYEGKKSEKSFILGRRMAEKAGVPLDLFCFGRKDKQERAFLDFIETGSRHLRHVLFFDKRDEDAWTRIPEDALLLLDALSGTWLGNRFFPSFQKKVRARLKDNPMLFSGSEAHLVSSS